MQTNKYWLKHFTKNLKKKRVDWSLQPQISGGEKEAIIESLRAWQLGETSDGRHLLAAASRYAEKIGDDDYVDVVRLFIKEEQKHGNNLGMYIDQIGEKRKKKDWGDSLFRMIRYFNKSMELWTITVIIVESAAQIFYKAIHDATQCRLLRSICHDILVDEAHHIKFQNERMHIIFQRKSFYNKAFSVGLYGGLFFATIHAVWFAHGKAMKAGGVEKKDFMQKMYYKFFNSMRYIHSSVRNHHLSTDAELMSMISY